VTSGGDSGTNGGRPRLGPWGLIVLVGVVVAFVTASSQLTEISRSGADIHWSEPILWETTSFLSITGLAPLIGLAVRRWPPREDNLLRFGLIHLGLTIPFAIAHVTAIFVSREAAYWAVGAHYGFFEEGGVVGTFVYEWRKDILSYAAIATVYWWFQRRAEAPPPERPNDQRIEIRDGGTAVFLAPVDIFLVEAAGNYITFNTAARNYLVRGTLAAWETRLAERGFVRVHRSRLVNRAHIRALKPTPSGDVEITLDDGRTVLGSRRYRSALDEARQT